MSGSEQDKPSQTGAVASGVAPSVKSEASVKAPAEATKPKIVRYRSRRSSFAACVKEGFKRFDGRGQLMGQEPNHMIRFSNWGFETSDPEEIAWLDKYSASHGDEIFRVPDVDPLVENGLDASLDAMQIDELRAACRDRGINFDATHDEDSLRYRLLKRISGSGKKAA